MLNVRYLSRFPIPAPFGVHVVSVPLAASPDEQRLRVFLALLQHAATQDESVRNVYQACEAVDWRAVHRQALRGFPLLPLRFGFISLPEPV